MTGTDSATRAVNALAQVYGIAAHYKGVAFILVKHGFWDDKIETFSDIRETDDFGWLRYTVSMNYVDIKRPTQKYI